MSCYACLRQSIEFGSVCGIFQFVKQRSDCGFVSLLFPLKSFHFSLTSCNLTFFLTQANFQIVVRLFQIVDRRLLIADLCIQSVDRPLLVTNSRIQAVDRQLLIADSCIQSVDRRLLTADCCFQAVDRLLLFYQQVSLTAVSIETMMAGAGGLVTPSPEYFSAAPIPAAGRCVTNRKVSILAMPSCQSRETVAHKVLVLVCALSSISTRIAVAVVFFFTEITKEGKRAVASD